MYHGSIIGGHSSSTMTAMRVRGLLYWKGQQKHIRQYVRECLIYQKNKIEMVKTPRLLQPFLIP